MQRTILIVEDDPFTGQWIKTIVEERFGSTLDLIWIQSEKGFLDALPEILTGGAPITAGVVDMLLPWDDATAAVEHTEPAPAGDDTEAGIRILARLRAAPQLSRLPVLIYTVNDQERQPVPENLQAHTEYMRKDEPDEKFLEWISRQVRRH